MKEEVTQTAHVPIGRYDNGGRWVPATTELSSCCNDIRWPSRRFPYSLLRHVHTKKHLRTWIAEHQS